MAAGESLHDFDAGGTRERRECPASLVLDFVRDYARYSLAAVDSVAIINGFTFYFIYILRIFLFLVIIVMITLAL